MVAHGLRMYKEPETFWSGPSLRKLVTCQWPAMTWLVIHAGYRIDRETMQPQTLALKVPKLKSLFMEEGSSFYTARVIA